jgi:hypothetical protein
VIERECLALGAQCGFSTWVVGNRITAEDQRRELERSLAPPARRAERLTVVARLSACVASGAIGFALCGESAGWGAGRAAATAFTRALLAQDVDQRSRGGGQPPIARMT